MATKDSQQNLESKNSNSSTQQEKNKNSIAENESLTNKELEEKMNKLQEAVKAYQEREEQYKDVIQGKVKLPYEIKEYLDAPH